MTVKELKNKNTKEVLNLLIKEFDIHTIERSNQYMNFFFDDDIAGALDTRNFQVSLYDNSGWPFPNGNLLSTNVVEDLMNKKIKKYLA